MTRNDHSKGQNNDQESSNNGQKQKQISWGKTSNMRDSKNGCSWITKDLSPANYGPIRMKLSNRNRNDLQFWMQKWMKNFIHLYQIEVVVSTWIFILIGLYVISKIEGKMINNKCKSDAALKWTNNYALFSHGRKGFSSIKLQITGGDTRLA